MTGSGILTTLLDKQAVIGTTVGMTKHVIAADEGDCVSECQLVNRQLEFIPSIKTFHSFTVIQGVELIVVTIDCRDNDVIGRSHSYTLTI